MKHLSAVSMFVLAALAMGCNESPSAGPSSNLDKEPAAVAASAQSATAAAQKTAKGDDVLDSCPGEASACTGEATEADKTLFGKGFELTASTTLTAATEKLKEGSDKVQVTGTVDAVCQKKGCWMIMRDGDTNARVFTYAGDFLLPMKTSKGRKCKVEGLLKQKTVTEKFAKHLEKDGAGDPSKIKGDQREWVLDATTIELL